MTEKRIAKKVILLEEGREGGLMLMRGEG